MNEEMKEKLRRIASLSKREIGDSEESVKINFVVPILECLGHNRLNFEYKYKDIVIKEDLPRFSKVVVETKNYDKPLDGELQQLERYCSEEHPLLGIIANGNEMRIFSPSWRFRRPFSCTLMYYIKRKELENDNNIQLLENIISKDNLKSGKSKDYVIEREKEIEETESEIEDTKEEAKKDEEELSAKIGEFNQQIEDIKMQINNLATQISDVRSKRNGQTKEVWEKLGLPVPVIPQIQPATIIFPPIMPPVGDLSQVGQTVFYVELPSPKGRNEQPAWKKHNLVPVRKNYRSFFPGYEIEFSVDTDIGKLKMYITSAPAGTQKGDPTAGSYIKGETIRWIRHHSELKPGDRLKFTVIELYKIYRLEIA